MEIVNATQPVVSVIIPCYNHGRYLAEAIQSVLNQTYKWIEIIVVDDGSTDNTKHVAESFPNVKYVFQENQGLSAARNTGILNSVGDYLVFLDADDLLVVDAIEFNINFLSENPELAFVSGAYQLLTAQGEKIPKQKDIDSKNAYILLLKRNYIEMHATVMFKRFLFEEFQYDTRLKACEDYDLYLKVARKYSVFHHTKMLAVYRMHGSNMSGNPKLMLESVLEVLERQKPKLKSVEEENSLIDGKRFFTNYYTNKLIRKIQSSDTFLDKESLKIVKKNNRKFYLKYMLKKKLRSIINNSPLIKDNAPDYFNKLFFKHGLISRYIPPIGKIEFGDLFRLKPFSEEFGDDRGGAIDRYYVEKFLKNQSDFIRGKVLEVTDNEYTIKFGGNITQSEILDIDESNPKATIIADLRNAPNLADNSYDCIILTQMLHMVFEYQDVVTTCYRILKPGGHLLLTVPGISNIDYEEWKEYWYWSYTKKAIINILTQVFPKSQVDVKSFGNVHSAAAFLYGMGLPDVKKEMLDFNDPHMQVIISANAQK
ncbi:glycosyltransferase [Cognataquiflexum aquatile]|uniref:glycosyltransferase n=1 Tax=Cognataquiflexum aquatile TaxID=2249427 RepID=UPI000DEA7B12|nr:glycosyltransferase [Cognataquiflexum aquatile]